MFEKFVGRSSSQCMDLIEHLIGRRPPPGLEERYKTAINQTLASSVTAVKGIHQAMAQLSTPYCVASSGSYDKMQTTLGKTQLLPFFQDVLFSTSDVPNGKPFADIYLHAAHKMGNISPDRCLVIEDSPLGIEGGVAAGMTVFGYAELMSKERLFAAGAHHAFDQMGQLLNEINHFQPS